MYPAAMIILYMQEERNKKNDKVEKTGAVRNTSLDIAQYSHFCPLEHDEIHHL